MALAILLLGCSGGGKKDTVEGGGGGGGGGGGEGGGGGVTLVSVDADGGSCVAVVRDAAGAESARCVGPVVSALQSRSLRDLAAAVGNDLTYVTSELIPEVAALQEELLAREALGAAMSGSGTAVYGIFDDEGAAERAVNTIDAPFTGIYEPVSQGVEIA